MRGRTRREGQRAPGSAAHAAHLNAPSFQVSLDLPVPVPPIAHEVRSAEVVLVLRAADGQVWLQTKAFYPPDTWRLPSGGLDPGEAPEQALARELWEEAGLRDLAARPLGRVRYDVTVAGRAIRRFFSHLYLVEVGGASPDSQDADEGIAAWRAVPVSDLPLVAAHLEALPATPIRDTGRWADWGRFRAVVHRLVPELLA